MSLDMLNILGVMVNIIDWMEGGGLSYMTNSWVHESSL